MSARFFVPAMEPGPWAWLLEVQPDGSAIQHDHDRMSHLEGFGWLLIATAEARTGRYKELARHELGSWASKVSPEIESSQVAPPGSDRPLTSCAMVW